MCGICGKVALKRIAEPVLQELMIKMADSMRHRGPDDRGVYVQGPVGLGMRRLSIIDLDTGHQPISNEDGSLWIVFNGEIYNHLDLRAELEKKGHRFKTRSDTEAIVHLYEEMGERCVERLRGMFALALWDARQQRLFLARDRIGQKPLYYSFTNGILRFGSEIKALLVDPEQDTDLDLVALDQYFTHGFVPYPYTIFRTIRKLPPAHYALLQDRHLEIARYWQVTYDGSDSRSEEQYLACLRELLAEAVRIRLMSDVPLGAFLSGGIDSSLVVALMSQASDAPVETFSIGFEEQSYNELAHARRVAQHLGTNHHEFIVRSDLEDVLPRLSWHFDEPFADSSAIPTYYVSKMGRQHVTVALTGDAGDEVFAGYRRYQARRLAEQFNRLPFTVRRRMIERVVRRLPEPSTYYGSSWIKKLKRFVEYCAVVEDQPHTSRTPFFTPLAKADLYASDLQAALDGRIQDNYVADYFDQVSGEDIVSQMMWVDLMTYLPDDILTKVDRMSMAVSLEVRTPLLDHKLIEFMANVPVDWKLRGLTTKYLFKKIAAELLPTEIVRRPKQGFMVPLAAWFRDELHDFVRDVLLSSQCCQLYYQSAAVERLLTEHQAGQADHSGRLWALLQFALWHETFLA